MDSLIFIGMIACLALVAGWYVLNEAARADGECGLLAIGDGGEPAGDEASALRYRVKQRAAGRARHDRLTPTTGARAYRMKKPRTRPPQGGGDQS